MKILLFGATGMVGQGVLRECLLADDVRQVRVIGRTPVSQVDGKLSQVVHADLFDYHGIEAELQGFDACFFCLGVSALGLDEAQYTRVTYDLTMEAAATLSRLNPQMTFVYVTGAGTDSSEKGRSMWARVKGRTENALQRLPFKAVYLMRPGAIQPLHGVRSKTPLYQTVYSLAGPLISLLRRLWPDTIQTTETVGRAMLAVARHGAPQAILDPRAINQLSARG
ncbi:NAD(P)H-binding protein [Pseudomonas gingeri]|uniref:NAD(P)H-binding protein n=1 Tax=Pseudomonas gingeri TaxID=117681 RepID=A0A7Y7Y9D5_9PSED|nr:NAD(P)H-binding protein [Pseudomonas gingeri]NWA00697.1 NAD(P)H-binding protein [Pseudomonas gingeri]NWA16259.1 NAD(P)H-binding protein [Pseudomonas gingeri]NWA54449.1 NAD(P)H-binding protein [Pseudomonas gingeri]NWA97474.1 NAD(P)H-binding protein [Pseudomonas gingeri]NWB04280.1 NAD(P)H-binding protein [Pseudomonas gingeri]